MFLRHQTIAVVLLLVLLCFVVTGVDAAKAAPKKETPKQPTSRINIDLLPPLQDVLADLGFTPLLRQFVRLGVTETRLLLKLTAMDFQMMTMEWADFTSEHVAQLKTKIKQLTELATVVVEPIREDLIARNKTIYGRLYMPLGVQSIEFNVASFGGRIPMGEVALQMGETLYECPPPEPTEGDDANDAQPPRTPPTVVYNGQLVVVVRGNCTFLQKALYLKERGARGMLVVNTEDKLESLASGAGINKTVTEQQVASLGAFFIVATSNNSYISLKKFLEWPVSASTGVHLVPLKCAVGGACAPLTPEEKQLQAEVSWGSLRLSSSAETFEFLTSNYGAPLPSANTPMLLDMHLLHATDDDHGGYTAKQRLLCEPISSAESVAYALESNTSFLEIAHVPARQTDGVYHALIAERGGCSFDTKTFHAQQAGYRLLILVNTATPAANGLAAPLQRIGGINPSVGRVGIPTLLVLPEVAAQVMAATAGQAPALQVTLDVAHNDSGFEHWTDIAYTRWSNDPEEKKIQLQMLQQKYQEHATLVRWLQAQVETLTAPMATTTNSHSEL
eukprot:gene4069-2904_t